MLQEDLFQDNSHEPSEDDSESFVDSSDDDGIDMDEPQDLFLGEHS